MRSDASPAFARQGTSDFNGDRSFNKQFAINDSMILQLSLDTKLYGYNAGNSTSIHQVAYNRIG